MSLSIVGFFGWWPVSGDQRREDDPIIQSLQRQALPDLIESITEKKTVKHLRILKVSGDVQDRRAEKYLVQAYEESKEEGVRCKILESIGKLHDPTLLGWLAKRLKDPHVGIQCFAIWALGELKSPQAADLLRRRLWDTNRYVQLATIDALGKTGKDKTIAVELEGFLRDKDVQVRYLAAQALAGVAGEDSAPELARRLTEESSIDVQEALAHTLGSVGGAVGVGRLIELLKYSPSQATEHYAEMGLKMADRKILMSALKPWLEGDDFRLKVEATRLLEANAREEGRR